MRRRDRVRPVSGPQSALCILYPLGSSVSDWSHWACHLPPVLFWMRRRGILFFLSAPTSPLAYLHGGSIPSICQPSLPLPLAAGAPYTEWMEEAVSPFPASRGSGDVHHLLPLFTYCPSRRRRVAIAVRARSCGRRRTLGRRNIIVEARPAVPPSWFV
jgi:hypothetical protein